MIKLSHSTIATLRNINSLRKAAILLEEHHQYLDADILKNLAEDLEIAEELKEENRKLMIELLAQ